MLPLRDVLHPNRPNVSKDELREKLADLYKSNKDQVSVFGFRTQYGGGKSTGFALVYDSQEALKKFEPAYRLVRIGAATKVEKPSRQQRTSRSPPSTAGSTYPPPPMLTPLQASNGRTAPRSSAVPPRPRAPRRTRTKRLTPHNFISWNYMARWIRLVAWWFGSPVCFGFSLPGIGRGRCETEMALGICI